MEFLNAGIFNKQGNVVSVKTLGMNETDNTIALYNVDIHLIDAIDNMPKELLTGRKKTKVNKMDTIGEYAGTVTTDVELPEFTATLNLLQNSIYEINLGDPSQYTNALEGILLGEKFAVENGGDKVLPLGVGGNVRTTRMMLDKDWKYFFLDDAKLIKAYSGTKFDNTFLGATNRTSLSTVLEAKKISNTGYTKVVRYAGVCASNPADSETDDGDMTSVDLEYLADRRTYVSTMQEGISATDSDSFTDTAITRLRVDYILVGSGMDLSGITDFGTNGESCLVIDSDTGIYEIGTTNGADTWTAITGTTVAGCVIFSEKLGSGNTVAGATAEYTYVATKTGAVGGGTAIGTTVASTSTFAVGTTYTIPVYTFSYTERKFVQVMDADDL